MIDDRREDEEGGRRRRRGRRVRRVKAPGEAGRRRWRERQTWRSVKTRAAICAEAKHEDGGKR